MPLSYARSCFGDFTCDVCGLDCGNGHKRATFNVGCDSCVINDLGPWNNFQYIFGQTGKETKLIQNKIKYTIHKNYYKIITRCFVS